jgi:hypothetical protein
MQRTWPLVWCVLLTCAVGSGAFAGPPSLYFSFDEAEPAQWMNSGRFATSERPFRVGEMDGPTATASAGMSGGAFDGRVLISMQPANVPVWGSDVRDVPDTEIERLFEGARSFTVTAWIKTESIQPQGRLIKTPAFQINYRGDRLETGFAKPRRWYGSEVSEAMFGSIDVWRFVAVSWKTDGAQGFVQYYAGTETSPVEPGGTVVTDWPELSGDETGCWLTIGNSEADGNRPLVGLIDEVRIWVAGDAAAVLTLDDLEHIRQTDVRGK